MDRMKTDSLPDLPPKVRFTELHGELAAKEWGANCGPGAIAAICGMYLDELRPYLGDFERKGYTNPKLMWQILDRLGLGWKKIMRPQTLPKYGLARIQWHGPWTMPGAHPMQASRHTHWVGAMTTKQGEIGIFDINAMSNGSGWVSLVEWTGHVAPAILKQCEPKASRNREGLRWSLTHGVEIDRARLNKQRDIYRDMPLL